MEITFLGERIYCWGIGAQSGTYLLRLTVRQSLAVRFGRFQNGKSVVVSPGDYLYVGSALAEKGSTSLARRLLRHASRSNVEQSHAIRKTMLGLFPQLDLGPTPLLPPKSKKLHWHVDFLLDEAAVDLTAVYLIRHKKEMPTPGRGGAKMGLETAVARWLLTLPEISPLMTGLGATDNPGGTHLLRVTAVPDWWTTFPAQVTTFLQGANL